MSSQEVMLFSRKICTVIVGIFDIILSISWIVMGHSKMMSVKQHNSTFAICFSPYWSGLNCAPTSASRVSCGRLVTDICRTIWIAIAIKMVYGNIQDKTKWIHFYVELRPGITVMTIVTDGPIMVTFIFLGEFTKAFCNWIVPVTILVLGQIFGEIVKIRIADAEGRVKNRAFWGPVQNQQQHNGRIYVV